MRTELHQETETRVRPVTLFGVEVMDVLTPTVRDAFAELICGKLCEYPHLMGQENSGKLRESMDS